MRQFAEVSKFTHSIEIKLKWAAPRSMQGGRNCAKPFVIEVRLGDVLQLFDPHDPSPLDQRDLNPSTEQYIVESVKELHARTPYTLVVHIDQPIGDANERLMAENAIHVHFARRARLLRRELRQLIRRGLICLLIGLVFLAAFFLLGQALVQVLGRNAFTTLVTESLVIGGWVAMWRPLEIFLYDWWPIAGEQRLHRRLSQIKVRVVYRNE